MNRSAVSLLSVCLLLVTGSFISTYGWNRPTHMVTWAIAYRELQNSSPQAVTRIVELAQDNAYRSNTLTSGTDQDGAVLPTDYVATVKPIAQRQVALAGYRLADELTADLAK